MGIRDDYYLALDEEKAIRQIKDRILALLTAATSTTKPINVNQGGRIIGGSKDRNAKIMLKVIELESELAEMEYGHGLSRVALIQSVARVEPKAKPVFVKKYCKNMSLNQIATSQNQTKRNICKILKNFEKNA
jgi:hypothetical protein